MIYNNRDLMSVIMNHDAVGIITFAPNKDVLIY